MAEPRRDPETGGRSLAEILREAGIESPTRGRRRRWDDPDDTGVRQRRADADADVANDTGRVGSRSYGRRASDLRIADGASGARAADPSTAAIPGLRPSGKPDVPGAAGAGVTREPRPAERRAADRRADGRRADGRRADDRRLDDGRPDDRRPDGRRIDDLRVGDRRPDDRRLGDRRVADRRPEDRTVEERRFEDRRQADRRLGDRRRTEERRAGEARPVEPPPDRRATDRRPSAPPVGERRRVPAPAAPRGHNPSTGPIPVVADDLEAEDLDSTPKESALAWLRFGGELVIALAAGVAIYFLFTVIWENLPYLAVVLAPLAVTGLVAGVGAYRHKMARGPVGPRLLAVLVFAGVLLTMWPAANLLSIG